MRASEYKKIMKGHLYSKGYGGVVEEVVNTWHADIIGVNFKGEVNEFEIKVSITDLRGEIKAIRRALSGDIYKKVQHQTGFWSYNHVDVDEKVSLTKLEKHYCYLVGDQQAAMTFNGPEGAGISSDNPRACFIPNRFYFAVPTALIDKAKELLSDITLYGLFNADTGEIVKPSRKLPRSQFSRRVFFDLFIRSCTELNDAENSLYSYKNIVENGHSIHVKRKHTWTGSSGREYVDIY